MTGGLGGPWTQLAGTDASSPVANWTGLHSTILYRTEHYFTVSAGQNYMYCLEFQYSMHLSLCANCFLKRNVVTVIHCTINLQYTVMYALP